MQPKRGQNRRQLKERVNTDIRVPNVRLIYEEKGVNEIMKTADALAMAREAGLDLVEISTDGDAPICKIIDFGKYLYNKEKKKKEARKNQKQLLLKEIKFRPVTDVHDYNFKVKHVRTFIDSGNRVKVTVRFRGRELGYKEGGRIQMEKVREELADIAKVESGPTMEGRDMIMMLVPLPKK